MVKAYITKNQVAERVYEILKDIYQAINPEKGAEDPRPACLTDIVKRFTPIIINIQRSSYTAKQRAYYRSHRGIVNMRRREYQAKYYQLYKERIKANRERIKKEFAERLGQRAAVDASVARRREEGKGRRAHNG